MSKEFPLYLTNIEISKDGKRYFVRRQEAYLKVKDKIYTSRIFFKFRRIYIDKPNCDFNCPPGEEFYCCKKFGCASHCGFFIWDELSLFSDEEKEEILSLWNNGTGFYRKAGCVLPRRLRSYICLSWVCQYSEDRKAETKE